MRPGRRLRRQVPLLEQEISNPTTQIPNKGSNPNYKMDDGKNLAIWRIEHLYSPSPCEVLRNGCREQLATLRMFGNLFARLGQSRRIGSIEADEALSKKDFLRRVKICRKEAKESRLFLRLIDTGLAKNNGADCDILASEVPRADANLFVHNLEERRLMSTFLSSGIEFCLGFGGFGIWNFSLKHDQNQSPRFRRHSCH